MNRVAFSAATVESGKDKGKVRKLTYATSIKSENANGLPVTKNSAGKDVVSIEVGAAVPTRIEFATPDEVREFAGNHFDAFVLTAANARSKQVTTAALTAGFRKLELAPNDLPAFVANLCNAVTPEGIFVPAEVAEAKNAGSAKKQVTAIASDVDELMKTPEGLAELKRRILAAAGIA